MNRVSISIVSHAHGDAVARLLQQLAVLGDARIARIIVTLNLPEPALAADLRTRAWPFGLELIENVRALGFAANHNQAFARDARLGASAAFAVVNPDIHLRGNPFDALLACLAQPGVGAAYPAQVTEDGRRQDHERLLPTPARLLRRYLPGSPRREISPAQRPDWVNAAFLLLRREAYDSVHGFDERYHLYGEDVDLCLRLRLAGWALLQADGAVVVHEAQRASHSDPRHLLWHVHSLLRLWASPAWRAYRARPTAAPLHPPT